MVWLAAAASTGPLGMSLRPSGARRWGSARPCFSSNPGEGRRSLQPSARLIRLGIGAGFVMAVATPCPLPRRCASITRHRRRHGPTLPPRALPAALVASVALLPVVTGEELVWRGAVQTELVRRSGRWRGVVLAALAYALAHAPLGSPLLVAAALLCRTDLEQRCVWSPAVSCRALWLISCGMSWCSSPCPSTENER